jgi:hypothetical protein
MEKQDRELIQKYLSIDPELKRCMEEHENYERKLKKWKGKKSRS